jgi:DNA replication protein DnaC
MAMTRPLRETINKNSLTLIGIPRELRGKTLADFDTFSLPKMEEVKNSISDYISDIPQRFQDCKGLFLFGSNGQGKTFLSSVILKEAYRHRYSCRRCTFTEYTSHYTRLWKTSVQDLTSAQEDFEQKFMAVEFLVLEEIGKEIDTSISAPILEDLLRFREDKGFPTIICTNLTLPALKDRYGESIVSLIKGNMYPLKIVGEDKREHFSKERWS